MRNRRSVCDIMVFINSYLLCIATLGCSGPHQDGVPEMLEPCDEAAILAGRSGCPDEFTCIDGLCHCDGCRGAGETCNDSHECAAGLVCPPRSTICHVECKAYFQLDPACPAQTFCQPLSDLYTLQFLETGACTRSECPQKECGSLLTCIEFGPGIGRCFMCCNYWIQNGDYTDSYQAGTCHPLGPAETMVVWLTGERIEGQSCDAVTEPCARGLVCINPAGAGFFCHRLCDFDNATDTGCTGTSDCILGSTYDYCAL